jgi:hypothetical protein
MDGGVRDLGEGGRAPAWLVDLGRFQCQANGSNVCRILSVEAGQVDAPRLAGLAFDEGLTFDEILTFDELDFCPGLAGSAFDKRTRVGGVGTCKEVGGEL